MRQSRFAAVLVLLAATACVAWAQTDDDDGGGAYDRLNPAELSGVLREMGMSELLSAFAEEQAVTGGPDSLNSLADAKIAQANQTQDPKARDRLIGEALDALSKIVQSLDKKADYGAQMKLLKYRLKIVDTSGRVRVRSEIERLDLLTWSQLDREAILAATVGVRKELQELTGLTPGSIPPFGSLFGIETVCDERLAENDQINFNAGSNTRSIRMSYADYLKIESPRLVRISA